MKKSKALKIQFQPWNDFKEKMTNAFKEQKASKIKNDIIVFSSVSLKL